MTMVVVEEMGAMGETTVHLPMNNQDILAQKNPLGRGNYCHFMYLKLVFTLQDIVFREGFSSAFVPKKCKSQKYQLKACSSKKCSLNHKCLTKFVNICSSSDGNS